MSYNKSYLADLSFEELEDFSPNLKGWRQYFFIGVSMIAIILALIVQKAIYKSLKNLGPRPIKEMIIPSQVSIFYSNYVFSVMKNISNVKSLNLIKNDSYLLGYFQLDDPFDYHSVDCKFHLLSNKGFHWSRILLCLQLCEPLDLHIWSGFNIFHNNVSLHLSLP